MDTVFAKVAGLDVHHKFITVGIRCRLETGKLFAEVREFGTMTRDLMALADYLEGLESTCIAEELIWTPARPSPRQTSRRDRPSPRRLGDGSRRHYARLVPMHPSPESRPAILSTLVRVEFRENCQKIAST